MAMDMYRVGVYTKMLYGMIMIKIENQNITACNIKTKSSDTVGPYHSEVLIHVWQLLIRIFISKDWTQFKETTLATCLIIISPNDYRQLQLSTVLSC